MDAPDILEPLTEENSNHPPILDPLVGDTNSYSLTHYHSIMSEIKKWPREFTGKIDGDPRAQSSYSDDMEEMVETITGVGTKEQDSEDDVVAEEFSMQMQRLSGRVTEAVPPVPLLPQTLSNLLSDLVQAPESDYTVWVPIESETIDKTAIGKFREETPGKILRFTIEYNDTFTPFNLMADFSEEGFSWYQMKTTGGSMWDGLLEAEEAQRLDEIVDAKGDSRMLFSVPDRVKHASSLLETRLTPSDPSAAPDGWVTTRCERDDEISELFEPRYNATFVHQETDMVLELHPEPAERVVEDADLDFNSDGSIQMDASDAKVEREPYQWDLHFAPDRITDDITSNFPDALRKLDIRRLLRRVDELAE
jgi:hypothetical protein